MEVVSRATGVEPTPPVRLVAWIRAHPLGTVVALALVFRLVAIPLVGDRTLSHEFHAIVAHMLAGNGYAYYSVMADGTVTPNLVSDPVKVLPSAYMPVGYPLFLSGLAAVFGTSPAGMVIIQMVQAMLGAAACFFLYQIADRIFGRRVALLAALLLAVYPLFVYSAAQISAVNLYVPLNLALISALLAAAEHTRSRHALLAGLLMGLLVLSRAETLLYIPVLGAWLCVASDRARVRKTALLLVVTVLTVSPLAVRNAAVFGSPLPLTLSGGLNLWIGNNPEATGTRSEYTDPPVEPPPEITERIDRVPPTAQYEARIDELYREAAVDYMQDNPWQVVLLSLKKLTFFWGVYWGISFTYPMADSPLYLGPWIVLMVLFVWGLILTRHLWRRYVLLLIYFVISSAVAMLFFVIPRYTMFVIPMMLPFVAVALFDLTRRLQLSDRNDQVL